ncbi:hypothetical protein [Anaerovibrio lipolyticus]|uniref:hypothetical protein n=1 Tax=Anaerovibrio lipolyticus TaxID=82374 RepID=UPI0012DBF478|nr:hypothetical protein [Anaerovibrio lipolyticus]
MDEGLLQERRIASMECAPETVIIGSSHVMYIPFDYENIYNAGMSGAYLGDYYSIVGLLKYYDKMPKRVVIGVDPWAFLRDATAGRQATINKYAVYLKNGIENESAFDDKHLRSKMAYSKLKELYSLSYFQSAKKSLEQNGFSAIEKTVSLADDAEMGAKQKILPEGRYVPPTAGFHNTDDIDKEINEQIKSGSIYQLGQGFTDVHSQRWKDFERLIKYLLDNGIEIQLYLPAWHPKVYELFATDDKFLGVIKLENDVRKLGEKYNIPVHGSYNPKFNKYNTEDFMDWLHLKPNKMYLDYQSIH